MNKNTSLELAAAALKRGGRWLKGALLALEDERWDDAVYSAQMAVEASSKAVLMAFGLDFPKEHDVSFMFKQLSRKRLPKWFLSTLKELSENISELAKLRGLAAYGYEEGLDAEYFKQYAPEAYRKAEKHHSFCVRLLREAFNIKL